MTTKLYPKYKESCLSQNPSVDMDTDTIKAALVDTGTYTYSDAHQYYSSVSGVVGTPQTLGSKTVTNGVFDAADVTFTAVTGNSAEAIVIYKDTGSAATSPLIAYIDGRVQVEIAADASTSATSITPEDLPGAIANGATLTKISGTGPSTITTTASASAGARSLSVSALASGITAGAVYEYAVNGTNLPVTPNGGDISITWPVAGIFSL